MTIYDYFKLSAEQKTTLLNNEAVLLEKYKDGEDIVYIYYLENFFVELTSRIGIITDNIPYKRGYKFNKKELHQVEKRNSIYGLAA